MSDIFISYSRKDQAIAEKIIDALAQEQLVPWIDWKSIPKGEEFKQEIVKGIEEADVFLFLASPDSAGSGWCKDEIDFAIQNGKRILPIQIRDTDPTTVHPEISKRLWISCREGRDDFALALKEISKTIRTDYAWLKFHTQLLNKALAWERAQKDTSRLLRGKELREAEHRLAGVTAQANPQPTPMQREYVLASQRFEFRIRRLVSVALAVGFGVVIMLALAAWGQRNEAVSQKATAQANEAEANRQARIALSRSLASQAQLISEDSENASVLRCLLSIESLKRQPSIQAAALISECLAVFPLVSSEIDYGSAKSMFFSHDGKRLVTAGDDGTIRIWDAESGHELTRMVQANVASALFSPDDTTIASMSSGAPGILVLWDAQLGKRIAQIAPETSIDQPVFSPDGRWIACGTDQGDIYVWNTKDGTLLSHMKHDAGEARYISVIAFSPSGDQLASGSWDDTVRVWDTLSGRQILKFEHAGVASAIVFSPDGHWIAASSSNGTATIWNVSTGALVSSIRDNQSDPYIHGSFNDMQFNFNGTLAASAGTSSIKVWDPLTGHIALTVPLRAGEGLDRVRFSPNGKSLFVEGPVGNPRVISVATGRTQAQFYNAVGWTDFNPGGSLAATSVSGKIVLWKPINGQMVLQQMLAYPATSVAFSPDSQGVAIGTGNGIELLNIKSRNVLGWFGKGVSFDSIAFSRNGGKVLSYGEANDFEMTQMVVNTDGSVNIKKTGRQWLGSVVPGSQLIPEIARDKNVDTIRVVNVETASEVNQFTSAIPVSAAAINLDDNVLALGNENGGVDLYQIKDMSALAHLHAANSSVERLALDRTANVLAAVSSKPAIEGGGQTTLQVWDTETGQMLFEDKDKGPISALSFTPDGKTLILGGSSLRILDRNDWSNVLYVPLIGGVSGGISSLALSPGGHWLAVGTSSGIVGVWDLTTYEEMAQLSHDSMVSVVGFSPSEQLLFSGDEGGDTRIWFWKPDDLMTETCLRLPRNLTRQEWRQFLGETPYAPTCTDLPNPIAGG